MKKVETVILSICSNSEIYNNMIFSYWIPMIRYIRQKKLDDTIKVFLLFGKNCNTKIFEEIKENILVVNSVENYGNLLKKTILGIKKINKIYDYKYLIRSNISSFWVIENLINLMKILPSKNLYAGPNNWETYISGCGIIMSRDLCQKVSDVKEIGSSADDIEIGKIVDTKLSCFLEYRNNNFSLLETKADKISDKYKILYMIEDNPIDEKKFEDIHKFIKENNVFHVRIKSNNNRIKDLELFNYLSSIYF